MSGGGSNEPNLTPFIDLFSVLICFLLMTAAWLSLESMDVKVEKKKDPSVSAEATEAPPPEDKTKKTKLVLLMGPDRVVASENDVDLEIPNQQDRFDEHRLEAVLNKWRQTYPDKKDIVLNTEANVSYGNMIRMYDFLLTQKWSEVGISPY